MMVVMKKIGVRSGKVKRDKRWRRWQRWREKMEEF